MAAKAKSTTRSAARGKSSRTTHRSTSGTKLYGKRSGRGKFEDVQTFERAHERDIKHKSLAERAKAKKTSRRKKK